MASVAENGWRHSVILCCGEALIDMLPRKTVDGGDGYRPVNGGSVYNTAVALGRLGAATGFFAGMSTDFFGDSLVTGLQDAGVSLKFVRRKDRYTILALVKLTDGHARYAFIDEGSAGRMLEKRDIPKLPKSIEALHFGSISLVPEPCGGTYEALLKKAAKSHVISLDPNIRPTVIKDKKKHLARLKRLIGKADLVKISDEDIEYMTGKQDFAKTARSWLKLGVKIVAVTRGGTGCEVFTKNHALSLEAPRVKVADTVGAGDTFTAGFLRYLQRNGLLTKKAMGSIEATQLMHAAEFAMKCAAITVSRVGADPPWANEV
jgi:fructokinase